MREISADIITKTTSELFAGACICPPEDVIKAVAAAHTRETEPAAKEMLRQLVENNAIAARDNVPACQDTGMAIVFMDIGQDVHITGGSLTDAVNEGVRRAYKEGYLRKSVLSALARKNTLDNTPAIIHTRIVPGENIRITAAPKGFGSENMSRIAMLKPSEGIEGILRFLTDACKSAGGNPCPPVILGVGIGGDFEYAAIMAKRALLRRVGEPSPVPALAALEAEALKRINALQIGAMGLKGSTYCLGVHMEEFPTHLAGLPVAVNFCCHALRHKEAVI